MCVRLCLGAVILGVLFVCYAFWHIPKPTTISYGVSFNTPYTKELGLSWKEVYTALLDDLGVKKVRLAAHWNVVEPKEGVWDFSALDEEVRMAEERKVEVVLVVGRRAPRWPECHVPDWAREKSWEEQKAILRTYITTVVERYKGSSAVHMWQVENEPFLTVFAQDACGASLDTAFLEEEVALVHSLDASRQVLLTDSGNLGLWYGSYSRGDSFGTSVYLFLWNKNTGYIQTILPPETYVLKRTLMELLYGKKQSVLIELSAEPWVSKPIVEVPLEEQKTLMNSERFATILTYGVDTRFDTQYLWGVEWWYWLKQKGDNTMWEKAQELFTKK